MPERASGPDEDDHKVAWWTDELPMLDPMHEQVVVRIGRIFRYLATQGARGSATEGLVMWQFKTLLALRRQGSPYEMNPSELATSLGLSRGAVTTRLTWLEDLGLVTREHESLDRRRVRVRLTATGHEALEQVSGELIKREGRLFAGLTSSDQAHLVDLLRKMTLAIEEDLDKGPAKSARGSTGPATGVRRPAR